MVVNGTALFLRRLAQARCGALSFDSNFTREAMATGAPPDLHEQRGTGASSSGLDVPANDENFSPPKRRFLGKPESRV